MVYMLKLLYVSIMTHSLPCGLPNYPRLQLFQSFWVWIVFSPPFSFLQKTSGLQSNTMLGIPCNHRVPKHIVFAIQIFEYVKRIFNISTFAVHWDQSISNVNVQIEVHSNHLAVSASPLPKSSIACASTQNTRINK